MLELPEKMRAGIGLQARKFKSRDTGEVDSSWTETPADKKRRQRVSHGSVNSTFLFIPLQHPHSNRVPTHTGKTGKPGKMRKVFPVREKSGNFV